MLYQCLWYMYWYLPFHVLQKDWCQQNFINFRNISFAAKIRKQLMELCRSHDLPVQSAGSQYDTVRQALAEGLFTNVARLTRDNSYITVRRFMQ